MAVLSDSEIQRRISLGDLVPGGDPTRASECSYAFRAGRGFIAGDKTEPVDFLTPAPPSSVMVEPGKMVWIRTSEAVKIPIDVVGFWWQTNTLSKKGLMLVNMSMVEPGYEGDLACLFVNFGNDSVVIERNTTVAKMVFMDIRGAVANPYVRGSDRTAYDASLRQLAVNQPTSFLQIGDLAVDLSKQKDEVIAELKRIGANVSDQATQELTNARDDAVSDFKKDAPKAALATLGWATAGIVAIGLITATAGWFKENAFSDGKKVARSEAEDVLRERITLHANPEPADNIELRNRIEELTERLGKLEKKK